MNDRLSVDYIPHQMKITSIVDETPDVKTFRLTFVDPQVDREFAFKAGQFGLYSVFGSGEATFCISSSPTQTGYIECSVKRAGKVTGDLHALNEGDITGFRGPYGNSFPIERLHGKNLIFIGGGIGLAPLRSLFVNCLDTRDNFGRLTMLYGARSVSDLVYKEQLKEWQDRDDIETVFTVDPGGETPEWQGQVGFVPSVLAEVNPSTENAAVIVCGPPIMIKFTLVPLQQMGFAPDNIITTLENRMKCGIGKCGRCNVGSKYVCKDGPVFTWADIQQLPDEL